MYLRMGVVRLPVLMVRFGNIVAFGLVVGYSSGEREIGRYEIVVLTCD